MNKLNTILALIFGFLFVGLFGKVAGSMNPLLDINKTNGIPILIVFGIISLICLGYVAVNIIGGKKDDTQK